MIEGLSLVTAEYRLEHRVAVDQLQVALKALGELEAVESVRVVDVTISVQFCPEILSRESIRRELVTRGLPLLNTASSGNPFKRFVDRLGDSNARNYGAQPLDCCSLNRQANPGT